MALGLPLGRKDPARRRRETEASTSAARVPERPAAPRHKTTNKRRSMFYKWLCCPCMRGAPVASPPPDEEGKEDKEEGDKNQRPKKPRKKRLNHEKRGTTHTLKCFSEPQPRRCTLEAFLKKVLPHEKPKWVGKIKMKAQNQGAEEGETIKEEGVAVEEETGVQEGEQSTSSAWGLSCCCLFSFLLLLAVFAYTFRIIEEAQLNPTQEELRVEMAMAALIVVTAVWSLYAFPTPGCDISFEAQVFVLLTLINMFLVLVARAVLAANTRLGYWCWWLVAILAPLLFLVSLCTLAMMGT